MVTPNQYFFMFVIYAYSQYTIFMPKKLWLLLLLGILLRFFLSYFQYSGDVNNHLAWANSFLSLPQGFFSRHIQGINDPNYPPLAIYFFAASRLLYLWGLGLSNTLNATFSLFPSMLYPLLLHQNTQIAFMKLFPVLADVGSAYLIFHLTSNRHRLLLSCLYLFNPATIYLSSVWGQLESLPIFFMLLSLYLYKKLQPPQNLYLSQLSFLLAALSKQTALWLLPIFLLYWIKSSKPIALLTSALLCVAVFILSYLPFLDGESNLFLQPFTLYLSTLSGSTGLANDQVWNLWNLVFMGRPTPDSVMLYLFSVRTISLILVFGSLLLILYPMLKNKISDRGLYFSLFLLSLVMFFFQTRVHEKHLAPALAFLFLLPYSKFIMILIFGLSLFFYFNLQFSLRLPFI